MQATIFENRVDKPAGPYELRSPGSRILKHYLRLLAKCTGPQLLDVGPVCGSNVTFFASHAGRLHVHDIITRTPPAVTASGLASHIIDSLAYEQNSFDGIHVWDLFDHIDSASLSAIVEKISVLLKPRGLLVMITSNTSGQQHFSQYFKVDEECCVTLQKSMTRRLPYYYRTNREIEKALKPLEQISSAICTNGVREFLFRLPK